MGQTKLNIILLVYSKMFASFIHQTSIRHLQCERYYRFSTANKLYTNPDVIEIAIEKTLN